MNADTMPKIKINSILIQDAEIFDTLQNYFDIVIHDNIRDCGKANGHIMLNRYQLLQNFTSLSKIKEQLQHQTKKLIL